MATPSSVLAWEIPQTEEPRGLQSVESQRVGHDLGTKQKQQRKLKICVPYTLKNSFLDVCYAFLVYSYTNLSEFVQLSPQFKFKHFRYSKGSLLDVCSQYLLPPCPRLMKSLISFLLV